MRGGVGWRRTPGWIAPPRAYVPVREPVRSPSCPTESGCSNFSRTRLQVALLTVKLHHVCFFTGGVDFEDFAADSRDRPFSCQLFKKGMLTATCGTELAHGVLVVGYGHRPAGQVLTTTCETMHDHGALAVGHGTVVVCSQRGVLARW